jgi:integrase
MRRHREVKLFHNQSHEFRKSWATACKNAGVQGLLFHDFRRKAVRNVVRAGVDRKVAMQIRGHKTETMFLRYNITYDRDMQQAGKKIEQYFAGQDANKTQLPADSPTESIKVN